jgi:hypothetical protein
MPDQEQSQDQSQDQEQEPVSEQDYHDAAPQQMKDHMWAALEHKAGLGPHPGKYSGPEHPGVHPDTITEADLQRAREGEISHQKMKGAMRGGDLGPEQFEQEQAQQGQAMQNLQALQGAQQAQQAQAAQTGVNAPPAPTGTSGVTTPYPAQAKPGAVPTTGKMPSQPPEAPGGQEEATQEPE